MTWYTMMWKVSSAVYIFLWTIDHLYISFLFLWYKYSLHRYFFINFEVMVCSCINNILIWFRSIRISPPFNGSWTLRETKFCIEYRKIIDALSHYYKINITLNRTMFSIVLCISFIFWLFWSHTLICDNWATIWTCYFIHFLLFYQQITLEIIQIHHCIIWTVM